jgi:hypothetical protein
MAFYEVLREDATGYASAVVRAHGTRQAIAAVAHLGFTVKNSVVERVPDGRGEPNKVLAFVDETAPAADLASEAPQGQATGGLYDYIG